MRKYSGRYRQTDVHDAEEEFLRDAEQAASNGHDQQNHSAEHMDGEIRGS